MRATKTEIKIKCKEKIKHHMTETEQTMLTSIENMLNAKEKYLKQQFGYFKEHNLAAYAEYYQQLITSYNLRHENHLANIKKEHNEKYKNMKTLLKNKHKEAFDLAKIKFEKIIASEKPNIISESSVFVVDGKRQRKIETIEKQKVEKLEKLNQTNLKLEFYKRNISNVLNNYANIVSSTKKLGSNVNYILDKNKMLHKYLSRPTENELKQLILDEELSEM